jgi:hypothetical protein
MFGNELPCQTNGGFTSFESHYVSICPNSFRKQIDNPLWPAPNINCPVAGSNVESIEKLPRVRREFSGLPTETFLLTCAVSEEILVRF